MTVELRSQIREIIQMEGGSKMEVWVCLDELMETLSMNMPTYTKENQVHYILFEYVSSELGALK
jgi:hypothetical protein